MLVFFLSRSFSLHLLSSSPTCLSSLPSCSSPVNEQLESPRQAPWTCISAAPLKHSIWTLMRASCPFSENGGLGSHRRDHSNTNYIQILTREKLCQTPNSVYVKNLLARVGEEPVFFMLMNFSEDEEGKFSKTCLCCSLSCGQGSYAGRECRWGAGWGCQEGLSLADGAVSASGMDGYVVLRKIAPL